MSWQMGAFMLLALALAAGFAWYERQRPDARIVALVGTLAAFAALGRVAFAALPNIKPTTDIVLIAGYALGGGPGFAVGALAALTSNFFFGQGPWTPWQMAAWGATGVLGAGLARLATLRPLGAVRSGAGRPGSPPARHSERATTAPGQGRIGRWPLAIACGVAGFAFTVIQDVGDWVTYSDHSSRQLGVYVGKGLGFDAVHAAGCLAFALAFGSTLVRSIQRFARRLTVTWISRGTAAVPVIAAGLVLGGTFGLREPQAARAAGGMGGTVSYLLAAQNPDGGFGPAPGQPSAELYSGWAALGLASAGEDLRRMAHGSRGLLAYVRAGARALSDVGSIERTILAVRAAGLSARSFAGHDLVATLQRRIRGDGSVSGQVNLTSFAVVALRAARIVPSVRTIRWLERQQDGDGGFNFAGAPGSSDVDDTGAVLEALAGQAGPAVAVRARAVAYLRSQQNRDGGFPSQSGGVSNAQSTAWAIQGLVAARVSPAFVRRAGSDSPLGFLRSMIAPDGAVRYARGVMQTPVWVTAQALMALEGKPLPLVPTVISPVPPAPTAPVRPAAPRTVAGARTGRQTAASSGSGSAAGASSSGSGSAAGASSSGRGSSAPLRSPGPGRPSTAPPLAAGGPLAGTGIAGLVRDAGLVTALVLAPLDLG